MRVHTKSEIDAGVHLTRLHCNIVVRATAALEWLFMVRTANDYRVPCRRLYSNLAVIVNMMAVTKSIFSEEIHAKETNRSRV